MGELGTSSNEFLTLCLMWYKKYMYRCMAHGRHPWCLHSLITCTCNLKWVAVKRESMKFFLTWRTLYFLLVCIFIIIIVIIIIIIIISIIIIIIIIINVFGGKSEEWCTKLVQWNLNILSLRAKELAKCVQDNKVLLYRGSFKKFERFKGLFIAESALSLSSYTAVYRHPTQILSNK